MSLFEKMFGARKGKGGAAPTTGEAIAKLRDTEEMLMKKQEFLEAKIEAELDVARKNGTKNKRAAILALKKKKRYEKQLQQIDGTLSTIEMQREALEGANTNTAVLTTMNDAAKAMKSAHKHMDIDNVHDMMDDIAEQQDIAKEISEAISNPVSFGQEIDEDELERELAELEEQELDKQLLGPEPVPAADLPEVPSTEPVPAARVKTKTPAKPEEDDDLAELSAWAS